MFDQIKVWLREKTELRLVKAGLTTVPDAVFKHFKNVRSLDLSDNDINTLPTWLADFKLEVRRVRCVARAAFSLSLLAHFRISFFDVIRQSLRLNGNPLQSIPAEVLDARHESDLIRSLQVRPLRLTGNTHPPPTTHHPPPPYRHGLCAVWCGGCADLADHRAAEGGSNAPGADELPARELPPHLLQALLGIHRTPARPLP
jgi:hypothetical protein